MSKIVFTLLAVGISVTLYGQQEQKQDSNDASAIVADEQAEKYLATFEKDGVPTQGALDAAIAKAKKENTIETWANAARLANSHSNVLEVLYNHHRAVYRNEKAHAADSDSPSLLVVLNELRTVIVDKYEVPVQKSRIVRNDCFLNMAELYLEQGNKVSALSYAMTAVKLTDDGQDITRGEALIKKIIEYKSVERKR